MASTCDPQCDKRSLRVDFFDVTEVSDGRRTVREARADLKCTACGRTYAVKGAEDPYPDMEAVPHSENP